MLRKVGVAMVLISLTLAVGVATAVVGFRSEVPETTAPSSSLSAEPQSVENTAGKREIDPGQKLEIDHVSDDAPGKEPSKEPSAPQPEEGTSGPVPTPLPDPIPDWPGPSNDELASTAEPRYFDPNPGAIMTLTVEALGLYEVPVFSSDDLQALDDSLMHVPETSFPWDGGAQRNVYIAGHYLGWPGTESRLVFYNLHKLKKGDELALKDSQGRVYRYKVSDTFEVGPQDSWVMGQVKNQDMLTLQTCIPPDFGKRLIVRANRV
jgi:sortase A